MMEHNIASNTRHLFSLVVELANAATRSIKIFVALQTAALNSFAWAHDSCPGRIWESATTRTTSATAWW